MIFCHLLILFKIKFIEKFFQEYHQSVKQIGSRSDQTFSMSGTKIVLLRNRKNITSFQFLKECLNLDFGKSSFIPILTSVNGLECGGGLTNHILSYD